METYRRKSARKNADLVQAVQVKRPYRDVTLKFPRSHIRNRPSGALDYIRIVDAPEGKNRAHDGDWIVKRPNGTVEVMTADDFGANYG